MTTRTVAGATGVARQSHHGNGHGDGHGNGHGGGTGTAGQRRQRPTPPSLAARSRLRLPELALGLLLVAGGALGAVLWYTSATAEETVVVAARDLPRGHVITAADLRPATVTGAEGIALVSGADASMLLGQVLTVDVPAAAALVPSMVTDRPPLADGEGLFSLALSAGQAPAELSPFDVVRLVATTNDPLGGRSEPDILEAAAEVWSVLPPTEYDPSTLVTLRGPIELAAVVAAADHVRLVMVADPTEGP